MSGKNFTRRAALKSFSIVAGATVVSGVSSASSDLEKSLTVKRLQGSGRYEYLVQVTDEVEKDSRANSNDVAGNGRARGSLKGGTDSFRYNGEIERIRIWPSNSAYAEIEVNCEGPITEPNSRGGIEITGNGNYSVYTENNGDTEPVSEPGDGSLEFEDDVRGELSNPYYNTVAYGTINPGYEDHFDHIGEITGATLDGLNLDIRKHFGKEY